MRPQALAALAGADHILHAGDIGSRSGHENGVIARLSEIAPVSVVRGNNDRAPWAVGLPACLTLEFEGVRVHLIHILDELALDPRAAGVHVVVHGHSHRPAVAERAGVLYVNPGSAGPRRFSLPVSVGWLETGGQEGARARLVTLAV